MNPAILDRIRIGHCQFHIVKRTDITDKEE